MSGGSLVGVSEEMMTKKAISRNDLEQYASSNPNASLMHSFSSMHSVITDCNGRWESPVVPVDPFLRTLKIAVSSRLKGRLASDLKIAT